MNVSDNFVLRKLIALHDVIEIHSRLVRSEKYRAVGFYDEELVEDNLINVSELEQLWSYSNYDAILRLYAQAWCNYVFDTIGVECSVSVNDLLELSDNSESS